MGRPPLSPEERRTERVMVNLTERERSDLEEAAGDESLSEFLRRIALRYLARRRK